MKMWFLMAALIFIAAGFINLALVLRGNIYAFSWFGILEIHRLWWGIAVILCVVGLILRQSMKATIAILFALLALWLFWEGILLLRGSL